MMILLEGAEFKVYSRQDPQVSHSVIMTNVLDLLASRQIEGLHSHSSKYFMCPVCMMPFFRLVDPDCFDPTSTYVHPKPQHVDCLQSRLEFTY
jgi:hypothetical protein